MFDREVLLSLKRRYSKDETVALLNKRLAEVEFENGILKSELAELKHELHSAKESVIIEGTKTKKMWLKDDLIVQYEYQLKAANKKVKEYQKKLNEWRDRCFNLTAKYEK